MPIKLAMLGLFHVAPGKRFAKAYVKPAGLLPNPTESAVNPLVLMGLLRG